MYNCKRKKIINITGKSYPTVYDAKMGVKPYPMNTHFFKYSSDSILILGCHDIKLFSGRVRSIVKGERRKKVNQFDRLFKIEKPKVILHHPHVTNDFRTWNHEWRWIENNIHCEFASGIYYEKGKNGDLKTTVRKSQSQNVFTLKY